VGTNGTASFPRSRVSPWVLPNNSIPKFCIHRGFDRDVSGSITFVLTFSTIGCFSKDRNRNSQARRINHLRRVF
jgi:hypothetical protein